MNPAENMETRMAVKPSRPNIKTRITEVDTLSNNPVVLVYGKSGTGKTHFGSTFPKPLLFLDLREKGLETVRGVEGIKTIRCNDIQDIDEAFEYLKYEKTPFKSIVLDQVTSLQDMYIADVRRKRKKGPNDLLHRKDWGTISGNMKQTLDNFRNMSDRYCVVFIAHERIFGGDDEDSEEGALDPSISARVMPSVATFLDGAVDVIGSTFIRESFGKVEGKLKKVRHVEYCMRVGPHAYYSTKIRRPVKAGPVPSVIVDPSYSKIIKVTSGASTGVKKLKRKS